MFWWEVFYAFGPRKRLVAVGQPMEDASGQLGLRVVFLFSVLGFALEHSEGRYAEKKASTQSIDCQSAPSFIKKTTWKRKMKAARSMASNHFNRRSTNLNPPRPECRQP